MSRPDDSAKRVEAAVDKMDVGKLNARVLAERCNVHIATVYRVLARRGLNKPRSTEVIDRGKKLIKEFHGLITPADLARKHRLTGMQVRHALMRQLPRGFTLNTWKVAYEKKQGIHGYKIIAQATGITEAKVLSELKRMVELHKERGGKIGRRAKGAELV